MLSTKVLRFIDADDDHNGVLSGVEFNRLTDLFNVKFSEYNANPKEDDVVTLQEWLKDYPNALPSINLLFSQTSPFSKLLNDDPNDSFRKLGLKYKEQRVGILVSALTFLDIKKPEDVEGYLKNLKQSLEEYHIQISETRLDQVLPVIIESGIKDPKEISKIISEVDKLNLRYPFMKYRILRTIIELGEREPVKIIARLQELGRYYKTVDPVDSNNVSDLLSEKTLSMDLLAQTEKAFRGEKRENLSSVFEKIALIILPFLNENKVEAPEELIHEILNRFGKHAPWLLDNLPGVVDEKGGNFRTHKDILGCLDDIDNIWGEYFGGISTRSIIDSFEFGFLVTANLFYYGFKDPQARAYLKKALSPQVKSQLRKIFRGQKGTIANAILVHILPTVATFYRKGFKHPDALVSQMIRKAGKDTEYFSGALSSIVNLGYGLDVAYEFMKQARSFAGSNWTELWGFWNSFYEVGKLSSLITFLTELNKSKAFQDIQKIQGAGSSRWYATCQVILDLYRKNPSLSFQTLNQQLKNCKQEPEVCLSNFNNPDQNEAFLSFPSGLKKLVGSDFHFILNQWLGDPNIKDQKEFVLFVKKNISKELIDLVEKSFRDKRVQSAIWRNIFSVMPDLYKEGMNDAEELLKEIFTRFAKYWHNILGGLRKLVGREHSREKTIGFLQETMDVAGEDHFDDVIFDWVGLQHEIDQKYRRSFLEKIMKLSQLDNFKEETMRDIQSRQTKIMVHVMASLDRLIHSGLNSDDIVSVLTAVINNTDANSCGNIYGLREFENNILYCIQDFPVEKKVEFLKELAVAMGTSVVYGDVEYLIRTKSERFYNLMPKKVKDVVHKYFPDLKFS